MNLDQMSLIWKKALETSQQARICEMVGETNIAKIHWQYTYDYMSLLVALAEEKLNLADQIMIQKNLAFCCHKVLDYQRVIEHAKKARDLAGDAFPTDLARLETFAQENVKVKNILRGKTGENSS